MRILLLPQILVTAENSWLQILFIQSFDYIIPLFSYRVSFEKSGVNIMLFPLYLSLFLCCPSKECIFLWFLPFWLKYLVILFEFTFFLWHCWGSMTSVQVSFLKRRNSLAIISSTSHSYFLFPLLEFIWFEGYFGCYCPWNVLSALLFFF